MFKLPISLLNSTWVRLKEVLSAQSIDGLSGDDTLGVRIYSGDVVKNTNHHYLLNDGSHGLAAP